MTEEKKCFRTFYVKAKDGLFRKEKRQVPCPKKKNRCEGGVLKYDDPKTNRSAGDPCRDDARSERRL